MRRAVLVVAVACLASGRVARADDAAPPLRASILCETPPGPGRFKCDVEARVTDATLSWADVLVVKVDDFILPLRGRLGPRDAALRDPDITRFSLGFVAKSRGSGDVVVRVRAVVCRGGACTPEEVVTAGRVVVR